MTTAETNATDKVAAVAAHGEVGRLWINRGIGKENLPIPATFHEIGD